MNVNICAVAHAGKIGWQSGNGLNLFQRALIFVERKSGYSFIQFVDDIRELIVRMNFEMARPGSGFDGNKGGRVGRELTFPCVQSVDHYLVHAQISAKRIAVAIVNNDRVRVRFFLPIRINTGTLMLRQIRNSIQATI